MGRMSNSFHPLSTCILAVVFALAFIPHLSPSMVAASQRKEYIIYMGSHLPSRLSPDLFYEKMMKDVLGSEYSKSPSKYLLYKYQKSFYGCVALLTDTEAQQFSGKKGVVSVFPNTNYQLHTTRSWDFMGFPIGAPRSSVESNIIVGVFDSGITPESQSFRDDGFGPVPSKWKGICQATPDFSCNKKIIGARFFRADGMFPENEGPTARDFTGHGTHTASTAAGDLVPMASLSGLALGTARGGVPSARIAVYKVCWSDGRCASADILAAFDYAIADGVDIISASLGAPSALPYFQDPIAIGSFHANRRGILSSLSAGNSGPKLGTVSNVAPWLLSVAASTIDRKIVTKVKLGNGNLLQGVSINTFDLLGKKFPLIYAGDAPNVASDPTQARFCAQGSLNPILVRGKIVLCDVADDPESAVNVLRNEIRATEGSLAAGAVGTIMQGSGFKDFSQSFRLPASFLGLNDGASVLSYIHHPMSYPAIGTILKSNDANDTLAPYIASFSSRGPNRISPGILKPDLAAPGVEILAAFSPLEPQSGLPGDERFVYFNILSGTSMACPHVTAAAAYVKSFHPNWSPAAIRSALMTTAFPLAANINPQGGLAYGAGHINPIKAVNPGLVLDSTDDDYIKFLCGEGISQKQIQGVTNSSVTCSKYRTPFDLNYPSIMVSTKEGQLSFSKTFRRTFTNVAPIGKYGKTTYKFTVAAAKGVTIKVTPSVISFSSLGEKQSVIVEITGGNQRTNQRTLLAVKSKGKTSTVNWSGGAKKGSMKIVVSGGD